MMREINLEGIRSLLTLGTDCDHLASVLDEVVFEYIGGILDNSGGAVPGRRESDNIYWMKALRDAVWRAAHSEADE